MTELAESTDIELIERARNGESEAAEELLNRCKDVMSYHVMKYTQRLKSKGIHEVDELPSVASLAVLEAINKWEDIGTSGFPNYAKRMINWRITNFIKRRVMRHFNGRVSDYDVLTVEAPRIEEKNEIVIKTSNPRDREIVELFLDGKTQEEIGKMFGITKQRIGQIIKKSVVKK